MRLAAATAAGKNRDFVSEEERKVAGRRWAANAANVEIARDGDLAVVAVTHQGKRFAHSAPITSMLSITRTLVGYVGTFPSEAR